MIGIDFIVHVGSPHVVYVIEHVCSPHVVLEADEPPACERNLPIPTRSSGNRPLSAQLYRCDRSNLGGPMGIKLQPPEVMCICGAPCFRKHVVLS